MDTQTETFAAGTATIKRHSVGDCAKFSLTIDDLNVSFSYAPPIPQWGEEARERETFWGTAFDLYDVRHLIQIAAAGDCRYTVFVFVHSHRELLNMSKFDIDAATTDDAILSATIEVARQL